MANVYQMVTDRIIEQMKQGIIPWRQPWVGGSAMAISYTSRKAYSLLNQIMLGKPGEWLTWNQIHDLKGTVKKGAKSRFVVFYSWADSKDENGNPIPDPNSPDGVKQHPILRWYKVFHLDDTEGIESKLKPVEPKEDIRPIDRAEEIINGYLNREPGLKFFNDKPSDRAYYSPSLDEVVVPMLSQYEIPGEYYSTTFHELTHSTMPAGRCDRKADNKTAAFGDKDYSREELVAEIGSAMLCNSAGLDNERAFKNSVAYIQSWLKVLKDDPKMIVWASGKAEKAAKYILNVV